MEQNQTATRSPGSLNALVSCGNDLMEAICRLQESVICECNRNNLCKKCLEAQDIAVVAAYAWENAKEAANAELCGSAAQAKGTQCK